MQRTELASLYKATPADGTKVTVCGWAKTVRDSKNIGFISLSDGSCYKPVQIVFQADKLANYAEIAKCGLYTSFEVTGALTVRAGENRRMHVGKAVLMEELVQGERRLAAHAERSVEGVGAAATIRCRKRRWAWTTCAP